MSRSPEQTKAQRRRPVIDLSRSAEPIQTRTMERKQRRNDAKRREGGGRSR